MHTYTAAIENINSAEACSLLEELSETLKKITLGYSIIPNYGKYIDISLLL